MQLIKAMVDGASSQLRYFVEGRDEIANENLITLQIAGAVGTVVCGIFFVIAPIIIPSWSVTKEYIWILPILAGSFLFSFFYYRRKKAPNPRVVEIACALFYILLLLDFIALSVFPYPNTPQIFISLCFMFMPALLIQRPWVQVALMLCAEVLFIALALQYKTTFSLENDIFNTVAAIFFSMVIMVNTTRLRSRNYFSRAKLQKLSQTDALTSLLNKKTFEELAGAYLAARDPAKGCALLVLDLDNFKQVNDNHGHPFGDALLEAAGELLLTTFRRTDLVGRIGGDEFAVMLRDLDQETLLATKCALLRERFATLTIAQQSFPTGCSMGVAFVPAGQIAYGELFALADGLLYEVKRENKGHAVIRRFD